VAQSGVPARLTVCHGLAGGHLASVTDVHDGLRCTVAAEHGWTILVLEGELDFSQSHIARRVLLSLQLTRRERLALDLRGLTFMDTSGIRLILEAMHRAEEFALVRGPHLVHDVLELVGLAEQLRIVADPAALAVEDRPAPPPVPPPREVAPPRRRRRPAPAGDIVEAIGHTPLVQLERLSPKPDVRIWAKLESRNPTGSIKDRVAWALIAEAEKDGALIPGQTILEPASGNTGISLAMICRRKGYRLRVAMTDNVTPERTQLLRMYGAEIVYPPAADGAVTLTSQYGDQANRLAHYDGTGREILEKLGHVSAFVAALGTGGTLAGAGGRLREELGDDVKIVAVEPMQGGFIPPIADLALVDRRLSVTNRDAVSWTRRLLEEEGIFAGVSSGATVSVAVRIAGELDEGDVVFIVGDDGWRYLSSGIHTRPAYEVEGLDLTAWW
jgi:[CysO sulfur-carrier protein]-thiocarboxylate-dependent cysteine synthase